MAKVKSVKDHVAEYSKHIKHGQFKGKGKEVKELKYKCVHHYMKPGKSKMHPCSDNDGHGHCHCNLCEGDYLSKLYTKSDVKDLSVPFVELINQQKMMNAVLDLPEVVEFWCNLHKMIASTPKIVAKTTKMAAKMDAHKKKGKKARSNSGGSHNYGGWGSNTRR